MRRIPKVKARIYLSPLCACVLLLAASAAQAADDWRSVITPADQSRLDRMALAISEGDSLVRQSNPPPKTADLEHLTREMKAAALPIDAVSLPGAWHCQIIKVGTSLAVNKKFKCLIQSTPNGLELSKIGGSDRITGYLYRDGERRMILLGHVSAKDEPTAPYSALAGGHATPQNPNYTDVVGVLSQTGPKHLRIVFPWPYFQSIYDVMVLTP